MKLMINIEKKYAYIIIGLLVLTAGFFVVNALAPSIDTSQGYHESNQVSVSVSGTEKTLQEAIDGGDFGGIDTNANTICTGTDVYLDGDGNCDTNLTANEWTSEQTDCYTHSVNNWNQWVNCNPGYAVTGVWFAGASVTWGQVRCCKLK